MTIKQLQKWVSKDWKENSHSIPSKEIQLLYIMEELGEVAEAIRKTSGGKERINKEVDLGAELADLVISIVTLANTYDVDLTKEISNFKERLEARHGAGF